jgi:MFS transporter, DHA1 family, multidrug resistance protein
VSARQLLPGLPAEAWRRNVYSLVLACFLAALGFVFAAPLLPLLVAQLSGGADAAALAWAGVAFGITPLCSALMAPAWTRLAERYGHRPMLLRSLGATCLLMGAMAFARSPLELVLLRVGVGAFGAFVPASVAALVVTTPRQETGKAIGTAQAAQVAGNVVGPLIGGVLGDWLGVRVPFVFVGLAFLVAFGLVAWLFRDLPRPAAGQALPAAEARPSAAVPLWLLWGGNFAAQFADAVFGPLLPLYLLDLRAPGAQVASIAGVAISVGALGAAIASYLAPRLFAKRALTALAFSLVGAALAFGPVALAGAWWQVPPLRAAIGAFGGTAATLSYVVAVATAAPASRGRAVTSVASAGLLGWAAGSFTCSALAGAGIRPVFGAAAGLLAAAALGLLLRGRRRPGGRLAAE